MGTAERREREKERRRKTIMKAAKKLFFKKGLENTTMDEIAEKAELGKGTLYLYFLSKEILAMSIIKNTSDQLNKALRKASDTDKSGIERIIDVTQALTDFFRNRREEFRFFRYMDSITASLGTGNNILLDWKTEIEDLIQVVLTVVVEGIKDGSIRKDIEPAKAAFIYSNMVLSFLIRLSSNHGVILMAQELSEDEIIESMFKMIIKMLESRESAE